MDLMHPYIIELLAEQALRERRTDQPAPPIDHETRDDRNAFKRTLASYLVRLGLRLDPAAGGGPGASDRTEARRTA